MLGDSYTTTGDSKAESKGQPSPACWGLVDLVLCLLLLFPISLFQTAQMLLLLGLLWASGTPEHGGEIKVPCERLASTQKVFTVLKQCV